MTTEAQPSAMRRKAGAGRPPPEIGRITAAKAVRSAVMQAADEVAGLAATTGLVEEVRTTVGPFAEAVGEGALLALVEGPGARYGAVVLDAQVLAALIEMQTTGRVVPRPAEPRTPTRTDAIMCADFIDRLLELVEDRAGEAELEVAPAVSGFRYALALADTRAIGMTLEDIPYRSFRFEIDLGQGAKSGGVQILLPFDPPGLRRKGGAEAEAFSEAIRAQVLETEAVLTATLFRREMSLAEVAGFEVGTVLVLPGNALTEISVEALEGTVVAHGRLGQQNGQRAVRLTEPTGVAARPQTSLQASPQPSALLTAPRANRPAPGLADPGASVTDTPGDGLGDLAGHGDRASIGD